MYLLKKIYTLNPYCSRVNAVCVCVCMYMYIPFFKQKYKHTRKGNTWGCSHWCVLPALEICIWLCLSFSTLNFITATDRSCKAQKDKAASWKSHRNYYVVLGKNFSFLFQRSHGRASLFWSFLGLLPDIVFVQLLFTHSRFARGC